MTGYGLASSLDDNPIREYSPSLADKFALRTADYTVEEIAAESRV